MAKLLEGESRLTQSQAVMGTPSYMAPEQAAGQAKELATPADIYSLGAILYELLAGQPPFKAGNPVETMRQVMEQAPASPRALNPLVNRDLETICLKCLEKEPKHRYGSAELLAEDLERWSRDEPILARVSSCWERTTKWARRRPAMAALAAVSGLAALALAGILLIEQSRRTEFALRRQTQESLVQLQRAQEALQHALELAAEQRTRAEQAQAAEAVQTTIAERNSYLASIAWADLARQANNPDHANRVLDDCLESLRNWEWHYLKRLCNSSKSSIRINNILATCVSAPTTLFSLTRDGFLARWDPARGKAISVNRLWTHPNPMGQAEFSLNGSRLIAEDRDNRLVRVWDTATADEVFAVKAENAVFAFKPDRRETSFSGRAVATVPAEIG